jgi:hypothetical protein
MGTLEAPTLGRDVELRGATLATLAEVHEQRAILDAQVQEDLIEWLVGKFQGSVPLVLR